MKRFLTAKHWQLFILTIGIPFLVQITAFSLILIDVLGEFSLGTDWIFQYMTLFPLLIILNAVILLGWFWAIGIELQKLIPETIPMRTSRFKGLLLFALIYTIAFAGFMVSLFSGLSSESFEPNPNIFFLLIPMHLFAMFCMFHSMFFVAKTIKTVQLRRAVKLNDFVGEFFMIWFYPIGIWFLQPLINKHARELP